MLITTLLFGLQAFAGFGAYQNTTNLGIFSYLKCSTGMTCSKIGNQLQVVASQASGGVSVSPGVYTNFYGYETDNIVSGSTKAQIITGSSGSVYLTQIYVPFNATLTGIGIANGPTVGTNKYILALYNAAGVLVANTTTASSGTLTAGAATYQRIPFVTSGSVTGPGIYWLGATINGSTDNFLTAGSTALQYGLVGSVTGQSFGVLTSPLSPLPTTATAGLGPLMFTY